jgi:phospholipid transport system substrate-binding protein
MKLYRVLALTAALVAAGPAMAQILAPDALIRQVSDDVITSLRQDRAIHAGDSASAAALVEAKVVPHFDFRRITRTAMGPTWRLATPGQQDELTREFKDLLVRVYSGALLSYRDQTIEVRPLREKRTEDEVTVRSFIRQSGAEPVEIEYDLERTHDGWKVFDVRVAGVSLVITYRTTFVEEVRNHGVDGLIRLLAVKNRDAVSHVVKM